MYLHLVYVLNTPVN